LEKIILGLVITTLFFSSAAFAQEISFGKPAVQTVEITISEEGDAHVTHIIEPSQSSRQLNVISNDFTNLQITDKNGEPAEYAEVGGEKAGFLILPTKENVYITYDLENVVSEENKMWRWSYQYLASTAFYLPAKADLLFLNGNPLNLGEQKGIRCHGCQLTIEYQLDKTEIIEQVQWEEKKFDVRIITTANLDSFEFDQPNKKISFDAIGANQYIVLIIPKELLWNPYEVFLNEEKIIKYEFYVDEKDVWLGIKPKQTGTVEIIGISAVPEFPITAMLVMAIAMFFIVRFNNKLNLR
jgi:hypothetical protein